MTSPADAAQRQQARAQGLIANTLLLPFQLFGVLCGSLILSVIVEWIGMHWVWPEQGWHHAQHMLEHELDQLSLQFPQSLLIEAPEATTRRVVLSAYDKLFVKTGVLEHARALSARAHVQSDRIEGFRSVRRRVSLQMEAYALAASYTLLTFLVRVVVLCLTLPLFITAAFVGFVDGLVRRDIRRFGAGRESGFVYHRARASLMPLAVLPWVTYLVLPVSMHPLWILLPGAIGLGIAVSITAASFKKYL
ncbi:integrating conjugative element membrane protein [Steroidobacter agaridevorans]|uniref:Integrating conjugative element membrane protein n=1 Tax=Steroidobacter agaridevorans TaxID=2695856 RepID=A0A829Y7B8_9GAMM|nr:MULTISPECIES: TIGR03747 family integrating conjugative element membrane protein [Steroidobacteraceae]GFE79164.1 integrating conjugative element membrane protein [Steroidobacter agaridevorans]